MSVAAALMNVSSPATTDVPDKLALLPTAAPSDGVDPPTASATGASSSSAAPPTQWPAPSELLLPTAVSTDEFPYVTFDEAGDAAGAGDDDEDEHWLQVAFSSSSTFSSPISRAPTSSALSSALAHLQKHHRQFVQQNSLASPAWQSLKEHTARYLLGCDKARALPIAERPYLAAADVGVLGSAAADALNPLLAPCTPPLPPFRRPFSSPLPSTSGAPSTSEEETAEAGRTGKRRRTDDGGASAPVLPSQRLVTGALGSHVLQLVHIAQLKDAITREHSALLHTAIDRKQRSNALILQQQQQQLLARQQKPSAPPALPQPSSSSSSSPDPHGTPSSAAAAGDVAPAAAVSRPSPASAERPMFRAAVATGRLKAFIAGLPSDAAAASAPSSYSDAQLLTLLPPLLAVHFLHCGFSTFSQSALQVMAEASIDYIRTAGKAVGRCADDRRRPMRTRLNVDDGLKREAVNGETEQQAPDDDGAAVEESVGRRVLHQLGVGRETELRRWYAERVLGVGARLKATEARLMELQRWVTSPNADPFRVPNDRPDDSEARTAVFSCEPFSPLRTLLNPPALPTTPRPLEEDREEPPPLDHVKDDADSNTAMAVTAVAPPSDAPYDAKQQLPPQFSQPSADSTQSPLVPPLPPAQVMAE